jgi:hypothetical protein
LEALAEVLEARFEPQRLTKERAAVLSEMSMVNTIEYRVECAILQALHAENSLSERFPIGLKPLIEAWQLEDVQTYHDTHYYPGNALLYIIGDLEVEQMEQQLARVMGKVPPSKVRGTLGTLGFGGGDGGGDDAAAAAKATAQVKNAARNIMASMGFGGGGGSDPSPAATAVESITGSDSSSSSSSSSGSGEAEKWAKEATLKLQSRHFPPIRHTWSGGGEDLDGSARIPLEYTIPEQLDQNKDLIITGEEKESSSSTAPQAPSVDEKLRVLSEAAAETEGKLRSLPSATRAGVLRVFAHELLSSVSFHLFAKRPVVPITSFGGYRKSLATR